jgi:N-acetyl-gamma-glutamyl-phosphate reductase
MRGSCFTATKETEFKMIKVAIIGITGYTGEELLKILSKHPQATIAGLYGRSTSVTRPIAAIYPQLENLNLSCEPLNIEKIVATADMVFLALPHRVSFAIAPDLIKAGKKVIDLSADFRLNNGDIYEKWYGSKHTAPHLLTEAVYGLPEMYREKIRTASLVANPGCYPTTVIVGLVPAIRSGVVDLSSIIVDAKSGISGAGRNAVVAYYEKEHPNFRAYNIGGMHRHIPEIEQELSNAVGAYIMLSFTPHIIPVERGMLSTMYVNLKEKKSTHYFVDMYRNAYRNEPFVRVLPEGELPAINKVVNTDQQINSGRGN